MYVDLTPSGVLSFRTSYKIILCARHRRKLQYSQYLTLYMENPFSNGRREHLIDAHKKSNLRHMNPLSYMRWASHPFFRFKILTTMHIHWSALQRRRGLLTLEPKHHMVTLWLQYAFK